jgi:hypothetical protein
VSYYSELREVLREHPEARQVLVRCAHCGIFFLTDPRNAKQSNLRCPFGCRAAHRTKRSNERSTAYYRTPAGRKKKANLNRVRSLRTAAPVEDEPPADVPQSAEDLGPDLITHIQVVTSIIERRRVRRDEVIELLAQILRQHHMGGRRSSGYGAPQMRRKSRGS